MSEANPNPAPPGTGEDEPLLGRAGDASQQDDQNIGYNLIMGTAVIAQLGIWILTATVWASVFIHPPLMLFSAHPLLNSLSLLLTTQAILLLQPTHTKPQKASGTLLHALLNSLSTITFLAALIIIVYNKSAHNGSHFESPHAILGLVTYILFFIQAFAGVTQYYLPGLYRGVENAKAVYKYHRGSGYVLLVLGLVTVAAATQTGFNTGTLHIQLWAVVVAGALVVVGVLPRVKKRKLGF